MRKGAVLACLVGMGLFAWAWAASEAESSIRKWCDELCHPRFDVREEAARRLVSSGEAAMTFVEDLLHHEDPEVQERAKSICAAIRRELGMKRLHLSLSTDRRRYHAGEKVAFTLKAANTGSHAFFLLQDPETGLNSLREALELDSGISIRCPAGDGFERLAYYGASDEGFIGDEQSEQRPADMPPVALREAYFHKLAGGDELTLATVRLSKRLIGGRKGEPPVREVLLPPGRYSARGHYAFKGRKMGEHARDVVFEGKAKELFDQAARATLSSEEIQFEVLEEGR